MINLSTNEGMVTFEFTNNDRYLQDGTIEVPVNSLMLVTDESEMFTFRKSTNFDIFISGLYSEIGKSKAELESWFKENACGSTGGCDIPSNLSEWTYDDNGNITSMVYTAETIPNSAYSYTKLTDVTIGNSVTSIGNSVFQGCHSLTSVTIGNSVTSIGEQAFYRCSGLTSVTIPDSVTSIGHDAFYRCSGLTSITIPDSVTSIGYQAFVYCGNLASVTIGSGVTTISTNVFANCTSLTTIEIPSGVTSIETVAFANCSSLTSITVNALTPPTLGANSFINTSENLIIYVPASAVETYKNATNWKDYASRIQAIT